jgi:hypothetical protein
MTTKAVGFLHRQRVAELYPMSLWSLSSAQLNSQSIVGWRVGHVQRVVAAPAAVQASHQIVPFGIGGSASLKALSDHTS